MGKLFKAAAGFLAALTLLYGQDYWAGWPALAAVKADITSAAPLAHLQAQVETQFGTSARAYGLHRASPKREGQVR
jgi:hypothetical protein